MGKTLGHYRILERLGAGGMGEVYLAEDTTLKREIALKTLAPELASDPQRFERFQREAEALAALDHPNIVRIHSIEHDQGFHFLTMEYVEGTTLTDAIPRHGLSLDRFFDIAIDLSDAVSCAHAKGIIHRDLKPGNVMLDRRGRIRVLDFGLAKLLPTPPDEADLDKEGPTEILTGEGHIVGTTPYMSPEQLRGQPLDERSDIFSLGVLFYLMATGHHPFRRDSAADVISAILSSTPPPITELKQEMPRHLGRVVRHCLEKEPSQRFQTALDVRNELVALRQEVSLGAAPSSSESLFPVDPTRRTTLWRSAALTAAAVVVALAGILIGRALTKPLPDLKTIAILPFSNLTGDPANDHWGEVFSSGLSTRLSNIYGAQLVSRSEVERLVREGVSATEIGRRLEAGSVIEGEILREGPQMRIVVSLTDAATNLLLWSEPYTSSSAGLLALKDRIAWDLESFFSIPLDRRDRQQLEKGHPTLTRAYAHYVRGRRFLAPGLEDPTGVEAAADNFRQAIRLHPEMAIARAGLSEALWHLYHVDRDPETLEQAREQASLALQDAPELSAAHVALARVERSSGDVDASIESLQAAERSHPNPDQVYRELADNYERVGELEAAEGNFRKAIALDDSDWLNWNRLGALLTKLGRLEEARQAFENAARLAPDGIYRPLENLGTIYLYQAEFDKALETYERIPAPVAYALHANNVATAYFFKGDMDKAVEYFAKAVELGPGDAEMRRNYGDVLLRIGDREAAAAQYREAVALMNEELTTSPGNPDLLLRRAMYRAKAGDCQRAVPEADELAVEPLDNAYGGHQLAYIYALCGVRDQALISVRKAIELGINPQLMAQEDEFASLQDDPEFLALTRGTDERPD